MTGLIYHYCNSSQFWTPKMFAVIALNSNKKVSIEKFVQSVDGMAASL